jgi:hypothetical protein
MSYFSSKSNICVNKPKYTRAFSLVEIAVFITISGMMLLIFVNIGSFVDKYKSQKIITSVSQLKEGVSSFKDVNGSLPGDFYGSLITHLKNSQSVTNLDCGNADGAITPFKRSGSISGRTNAQLSNCNISNYDATKFYLYNESKLFVKHLMLFGLAMGNQKLKEYTGKNSSEEYKLSPGVYDSMFIPITFATDNYNGTGTAPLYAFKNDGLNNTQSSPSPKNLTIILSSINNTSVSDNNLKNTIFTGRDSPNTNIINGYTIETQSGNLPTNPVIPLSVAQYVDAKMDDGKYNDGIIKYCSSTTTCTNLSKDKVFVGFLYNQ